MVCWSRRDSKHVCLLVQEVTRQLPKSAHHRSMLSKQWTDCTYLDVSPAQEQLTDDGRRQFNITAMEHAKEVCAATKHMPICIILHGITGKLHAEAHLLQPAGVHVVVMLHNRFAALLCKTAHHTAV